MGVRDALTRDLTPVERWRVALVTTLMGIFSFIFWSLGLIPLPGDHGFIYAATFETRVQAVVGDVKKELGELKQQSQQTAAKVDKVAAGLDAVLTDYYSKRITSAVRQRCKLPVTDVDERARLWEQINSDVRFYRQYSGDATYQRPSCEEV
jgi:hypothetical protein